MNSAFAIAFQRADTLCRVESVSARRGVTLQWFVCAACVALSLWRAAPLRAQVSQAGVADRDLPLYVGERECLTCHGTAHQAPACKQELPEKHHFAYDALHKPEAEHIAGISGLSKSPAQSHICLGCHATGAEEGQRWQASTFDITRGVQCEACHGPGSLHVATRRRELASERGDREAAPRQTFLQPVESFACTSCHRDKNSHRLVIEQGLRLSPLNDEYKTPVNLAMSADGTRLFVVCQNSNELLVLDANSGRVLREVSVGRRPDSVAVSCDGRWLAVSNRFDDVVSIIHADTLEPETRVVVGDGPHGLVFAAGGEWLYVLNTEDDTVSVIETSQWQPVCRLQAGEGPWAAAMGADGRYFYATSVRPDLTTFQRPHRSEVARIDTTTHRVVDRFNVPEANMLKGIDVVPAGPHRGTVLFALMRSKEMVPATRLTQGWTITNGLGVIHPDGRVDQVLLDLPFSSFPDPNGLAVSPDGTRAVITSGGANEIAIVAINDLMGVLAEPTTAASRETLARKMGACDAFVERRVAVGRNPRGATFSPDSRFAYVVNALDDTVSRVAVDSGAVATFPLGGPTEISTTRIGQRVFHSADISFGRQFSCQSCHPDGHLNGLTVDIEADGVGLKPVDNRTLRGILDTNPFKWEGINPSLHRQCGPRLAVFFTRIEPYTPEELDALVRYMTTIERPANPHHDAEGLTEQQYRGKLIFERRVNNMGEVMRPEQRCVTCHHGPYKTSQARAIVHTTMWFDTWVNLPLADQSMYDYRVYGDLGIFYFADAGVPAEPLDIPHLTNIYNGAPYMHNGAAHTLEEIWTRYNYVEGHGQTTDLTREEFNDLIAYLLSL